MCLYIYIYKHINCERKCYDLFLCRLKNLLQACTYYKLTYNYFVRLLLSDNDKEINAVDFNQSSWFKQHMLYWYTLLYPLVLLLALSDLCASQNGKFIYLFVLSSHTNTITRKC